MKKFIFKWFRLGWGGCYGYLIVSGKKMSIVGKVWGFVISGYLYGWLVMIVFSCILLIVCILKMS